MATLLLALLGCAGDKGADDTGGGGGTLGGTISMSDGNSATVNIQRAYGFNDGEAMLAYLSSDPDTKCSDAAKALSGDAVTADQVYSANTCNLRLEIATGYTATDPPSYTANDEDAYELGTNLLVTCAFAVGSFVEGEDGYAYQGETWYGYPYDFAWTIGGGDAAPFSFDIAFTALDGTGPDGSYVPADADVSGTVEGEWCPGLVEAML